jgi:hypothetical protein
MALFDWTKRIEDGRALSITGGAWIAPAIYGLIAAKIADVTPFTGAALCGMIAFLIPSAASLWPTTGMSSRGRKADDGPEFVFKAEMGVGDASPPPPIPGDVANHPQNPSSAGAQAAAAAAAAATAHRRRMVESAEPSFVGRAANAGMAFLAKCMLLLGMVLAGLYGSSLGGTWHDKDGRLTFSKAGEVTAYVGGRETPDVRFTIPRAAVLAPLVLGGVLLLASRRSDGGLHFMRGFIGCCFVIAVALMAIGPASEPLRIFLTTNDWELLNVNDRMQRLIATLSMLAVALALLFWPRRAAARTVVI